MNHTNVAVVKPAPTIVSIPALSLQEAIEPSKVLEFAHKAAKALKDVIDSSSKKVMINGEQFLTFENWQTIARFYNITVGTESTKPITKDNKIFGYESKAVAYRDGIIISSAEASTFRDEASWRDKPSFQLKSMAQTRAAAKCLRNILAWVVVLAGYKPTPAEEMIEHNAPVSADSYSATKNFRSWEDAKENVITPKQSSLLRSLIIEKVLDEDAREQKLSEIKDLTKSDASIWISDLINDRV